MPFDKTTGKKIGSKFDFIAILKIPALNFPGEFSVVDETPSGLKIKLLRLLRTSVAFL